MEIRGKAIWAKYFQDMLQTRRGEKGWADMSGSEPDPTLQLADVSFQEWYTAEDEKAFGGLRTR